MTFVVKLFIIYVFLFVCLTYFHTFADIMYILVNICRYCYILFVSSWRLIYILLILLQINYFTYSVFVYRLHKNSLLNDFINMEFILYLAYNCRINWLSLFSLIMQLYCIIKLNIYLALSFPNLFH